MASHDRSRDREVARRKQRRRTTALGRITRDVAGGDRSGTSRQGASPRPRFARSLRRRRRLECLPNGAEGEGWPTMTEAEIEKLRAAYDDAAAAQRDAYYAASAYSAAAAVYNVAAAATHRVAEAAWNEYQAALEAEKDGQPCP